MDSSVVLIKGNSENIRGESLSSGFKEPNTMEGQKVHSNRLASAQGKFSPVSVTFSCESEMICLSNFAFFSMFLTFVTARDIQTLKLLCIRSYGMPVLVL